MSSFNELLCPKCGEPLDKAALKTRLYCPHCKTNLKNDLYIDFLEYIIEHDIAGNARRVGQHLAAELNRLKQKYPLVADVRGRGLLMAMEFSRDIASPVVVGCLDRGLLVNRLKPNALRFMPPLVINNDEIDEGIEILDKVLLTVGD